MPPEIISNSVTSCFLGLSEEIPCHFCGENRPRPAGVGVVRVGEGWGVIVNVDVELGCHLHFDHL